MASSIPISTASTTSFIHCDAHDSITNGRTNRHNVIGFRPYWQPGPNELQRGQGGNYRRNKSISDGARKKKNHRQLRRGGLIDTGMIDERILAKALPDIALNRMGTPEEVANVVAFLMSDAASYVTRQVISINGGFR